VREQIKTAIRMGIEPRVEMSFADEKTIIEYQDLGARPTKGIVD
jgi:hypothetical protein